jgi:hypothetical protein
MGHTTNFIKRASDLDIRPERERSRKLQRSDMNEPHYSRTFGPPNSYISGGKKRPSKFV